MKIAETIENIQLTPSGLLQFIGIDGDWQEILFNLGALRLQSTLPATRY
jgi:hypothetical protein